MSILATVAVIVILVSALTRWFAIWLSLRLNRQSDKKQLKQDFFTIRPYLQLGNPDPAATKEELEIHWHTQPIAGEHDWKLEIKPRDASFWLPIAVQNNHLAAPGISELTHFKCVVQNLESGAVFDYRISKSGQVVFSASACARKSASQPYRFGIFGDLCNGKEGSKKIAYQLSRVNPDFVALAGDVVYQNGRSSEYLERYFPVYNHEKACPDHGAPLIASRLFVTAAGNHDMGTPELWDVRDLNKMPDLLAYFIFWSQPLNGPLIEVGAKNTPDLLGDEEKKKAFLDAAGARFPQMANYSFDYANAHWLMLDSNNYMDWTNQELRNWVEKDLAGSNATWKFVCFHHPPFTCDPKHVTEQRMRLLAGIFEKCGVDIVFCGHHHAYERDYPLSFKLQLQPDGSPISKEGYVTGECILDKEYDGATITKPNGILYLVSGGGGGKLLMPLLRVSRDALPAYTYKVTDDLHSFTYCDASDRTLTFHQVTEDGVEIDTFVVSK